MLSDAELPIPSHKARISVTLLMVFWWVLIVEYTVGAALVFTVVAGVVFFGHLWVSRHYAVPPPTNFEFLVCGSAVIAGIVQVMVAGWLI